jgi:hypothetical protein
MITPSIYRVLAFDDRSWGTEVDFELRPPDECVNPDGSALAATRTLIEAHFHNTPVTQPRASADGMLVSQTDTPITSDIRSTNYTTRTKSLSDGSRGRTIVSDVLVYSPEQRSNDEHTDDTTKSGV